MEMLSDDLIDRASTLFMSTLQYTVEMLTWEQSDSLPTDIQPEGELDDSYVTMMFNDELHTYEQVRELVVRQTYSKNTNRTNIIIGVLLRPRSRAGCLRNIKSTSCHHESIMYKCLF